MQIRKTDNLNFYGKIELLEKPKIKDELFRWTLNSLKHYCGGKNVTHEISLNEKEKTLYVFCRLFPKVKLDYIHCFQTLKRIEYTSKENIDNKIKELNNWTKKIQKDFAN